MLRQRKVSQFSLATMLVLYYQLKCMGCNEGPFSSLRANVALMFSGTVALSSQPGSTEIFIPTLSYQYVYIGSCCGVLPFTPPIFCSHIGVLTWGPVMVQYQQYTVLHSRARMQVNKTHGRSCGTTSTDQRGSTCKIWCLCKYFHPYV